METTIKQIEDMSLNAWPSHKMELYDGWILRFSYFYTHRTNSVEQLEIPLSHGEKKSLTAKASTNAWELLLFLKSAPLFPRTLIMSWRTADMQSNIQQTSWQ